MNERLIRLYEDSRQPGTCKSEKCGEAIEYFETFPRHKQMPMNPGAVSVKTEMDVEQQRVVGYFAMSDSHFSTCTDADAFRH